MAAKNVARSLLATKHSLASAFSHSCAAATSAVVPNSGSFLFRLRPLVAAASASYLRRLVPAISTRTFSTRQTASSLNDPNPNWSNRPPKETILLDGCDFEHWLVVMEKPEGDPTRDEIIDSYIKTLAMVVGSDEEARMKIYSVSTRHYYAFGALVSEELSYKLKELPKVRWVLPDSYLDVQNKDYGGEPFINGQAVPYDPKYHEEWVRNNARANERNRRNDRPRNFDRSRNFERRREMRDQNSGQGGNYGGGGGAPSGNYGGGGGQGPPPNAPNMGGQSLNYPANNVRPPTNNAYNPDPNRGGVPYQSGPGPNQGGFRSHGQGHNQSYLGGENRGFGGPGQVSDNFALNGGYGQNNFGPNMGSGQGQYQNAYPPNTPPRDIPPSSNY